MRNANFNILSASDSVDGTGGKFDSNQLVSASFMAVFGDATVDGTFKIQASNDPCAFGNMAVDFTPTNWVDIPSATATITNGASALITIANMTYRWVRAVWAVTGAGVQTVTTVADVSGSLNSKYFLLSAPNGGVNYYVWINVDSGGVDPALPGKTGVPVAISSGASAATVATAVAAAVDALAAFVSAAVGAVVTITNASAGGMIPASDGAAPTGFAFAVTNGGSSTINVNLNALGI